MFAKLLYTRKNEDEIYMRSYRQYTQNYSGFTAIQNAYLALFNFFHPKQLVSLTTTSGTIISKAEKLGVL